jgi:hypothetical protein
MGVFAAINNILLVVIIVELALIYIRLGQR